MTAPKLYALDVPATAGIVLPMESDKTATLNTAEQNLSSLAGDATLTNMAVNNLTITAGSGRWVLSRPFRSGYVFGGASSPTWMTKAAYQPLDGKDHISIEVWFIPRITPSGSADIIVSQKVSGAGHGTVQLGINTTGTVYFRIDDGDGTNVSATSTGTITPGALHHAVGTWDKDVNSGKPVIYLDTSADTAASGNPNVTDANSDLVIGGYAAAYGNYEFDGVLCRVALYNSQLSTANVTTLYNREAIVIAGASLLALWELAEQIPAGTTAYDSYWRRDGLHGRAIEFYDPSNTYLSVADDADLEIGAGDFTVAFTVYTSSLAAKQYLLSKASALQLAIETDGDLSVSVISVGDTDTNTTTTQPIAVNTWYTVVITRTSNVVAVYVNGVSQALDDTANDVTMTNNANAWRIGGDGADGLTGRLSFFLLDPSTAYSAQWCKDVYRGLPLEQPVWEEPQSGPSLFTGQVVDTAANDYKARFARNRLHQTQLLLWMGDAYLCPLFWRGRLQTVRHDIGRRVFFEATDLSQIHSDTHDATYGLEEGTIGSADLYSHFNTLKDASITLTHTPNPLGVARKVTVSRGTTVQQAFNDLYTLYGLPGYVDPWGDHWLRKYTQPSDPDGWCEATTGWTSTGTFATDTGVVGSNSLKVTATAGSGGVAIIYRTISLNMDAQPYLSVIIKWDNNFEEPFQVQLQSSAGNYYFMGFQGVGLNKASWNHLLLKLPDAYSNYGWAIVGSPDRAALTRITFCGSTETPNKTFWVDAVHLFGLGDAYPAAHPGDSVILAGEPHWSRAFYADRLFTHWDNDGGGTSPVNTETAFPLTGAVAAGEREMVQANQAVADEYEAGGWTFETLAYRASVYQTAASLRLLYHRDLLGLRRGDATRITSTGASLTGEYGWVQSLRIRPDGIDLVFGAPKRSPPAPIPTPTAAPVIPPVPIPLLPLYLIAGGRALPRPYAEAKGLREDFPQPPSPAGVVFGLWINFAEELRERQKYAGRYHP